MVILGRSLLHNIGVVLVGFAVAVIGIRIDRLFAVPEIHSLAAAVIGAALIGTGFVLRLWATVQFYERGMKVIALQPQPTLLTSGPYRFSRNPLYLGGNVFVFFGAALVLGSPAALLLTVLHLPLVDLFIRREERQLDERFGEDWRRYRKRVNRWISIDGSIP